jgi:PII-like signaling protein
VSQTYLKLTAYFGERLRHRDRFLADALLDLYAENGLAASVVLRGIASFGPRHVLRSDQSLSLSEDSPIAVVAVDSAETIGPLADAVAGMTSRGLVTLERARLVVGLDATVPDMAKLTVYLGRQDRVAGQPAHRAICAALHRHGFAGAAVFLGVDGTRYGQRRRAHFFSRNADVPQMITAVGRAGAVTSALAELTTMTAQTLCTVERIQMCKRGGELIAPPTALPAIDGVGRQLWQKLTVHTSEATLDGDAPIHRALVRRLRDSDVVSGATVLRGIWGFHGAHKPHGDKLFQLTRQVPVTTIVVDSPARIAEAFPIVDELTAEHGMVTSETVPAMVSIDGADRVGGTGLAFFGH